MTKSRFPVGVAVVFIIAIALIAIAIARSESSLSEVTLARSKGTNAAALQDSGDKKNLYSDTVYLEKKKQKLGNLLHQIRRSTKNSNQEYSQQEIHRITKDKFETLAPVFLENMFQAQKIDNEWTNTISEETEQYFSKMQLEGTVLNSVECRETLCKVEFDHYDLEKQATFFKGPVNNGPWIRRSGETFGSFDKNEGGTMRSTLYFTREDDFDTFWEMRKRMAHHISYSSE